MHSTHSHHQHDFDHVARIRARRGGFGPGGFGPGGPRGFGPGGPRGGKRRKRGEIRDAILQLLTDRPMHGYEMIQEIEERSDSRWSPSPGSVYPMLQLLEDEGLISHAELEGRKVFSLTTPGTAHVQEHLADRTPPWEAQEGEAQAPHHRMFHAGGQMMLAAVAGSDHAIDHREEFLLDLVCDTFGLAPVGLADDDEDPADVLYDLVHRLARAA